MAMAALLRAASISCVYLFLVDGHLQDGSDVDEATEREEAIPPPVGMKKKIVRYFQVCNGGLADLWGIEAAFADDKGVNLFVAGNGSEALRWRDIRSFSF